MSEESLITQELKDILGKERVVATYEVERGAIRKLAAAIEDPNPLWQDEQYANKTRYGGIIAPPTFINGIRYPEFHDDLMKYSGLKRLLNGGVEIEYFEPIRPGDIITRKDKVIDACVRQGKQGPMLFEVCQLDYVNQHDKLAVRVLQTIILH